MLKCAFDPPLSVLETFRPHLAVSASVIYRCAIKLTLTDHGKLQKRGQKFGVHQKLFISFYELKKLFDLYNTSFSYIDFLKHQKFSLKQRQVFFKAIKERAYIVGNCYFICIGPMNAVIASCAKTMTQTIDLEDMDNSIAPFYQAGGTFEKAGGASIFLDKSIKKKKSQLAVTNSTPSIEQQQQPQADNWRISSLDIEKVCMEASELIAPVERAIYQEVSQGEEMAKIKTQLSKLCNYESQIKDQLIDGDIYMYIKNLRYFKLQLLMKRKKEESKELQKKTTEEIKIDIFQYFALHISQSLKFFDNHTLLLKDFAGIVSF